MSMISHNGMEIYDFFSFFAKILYESFVILYFKVPHCNSYIKSRTEESPSFFANIAFSDMTLYKII